MDRNYANKVICWCHYTFLGKGKTSKWNDRDFWVNRKSYNGIPKMELTEIFNEWEICVAENYVTISKVIPLVNCVRDVLRTKNPKHNCTIQLRHELEQQINKRFNRLEHHYILALATVLDPKFKTLHLQDTLAKCAAINTLNAFIQHLDVTVRPYNDTLDQSDSQCHEPRKFDILEYHNRLALQNLKRNIDVSILLLKICIPKYTQSKVILKIKCQNKCTMREALKIYKQQTATILNSSFANIVRVQQNNNENIATKTLPSLPQHISNTQPTSPLPNSSLNIQSHAHTNSINSTTENNNQQVNNPQKPIADSLYITSNNFSKNTSLCKKITIHKKITNNLTYHLKQIESPSILYHKHSSIHLYT
ncbi:uncharacterized protein [Eurosta solidaginis]|uniref:uncharacterized protein n=1 Tax=Eurosta solidaginis TaxID=178769 RepID=UPI003530AC8E